MAEIEAEAEKGSWTGYELPFSFWNLSWMEFDQENHHESTPSVYQWPWEGKLQD